MKDDLHLDLLEIFVKHKVVPFIILRNEKIRVEYEKMKKEGIKPKTARAALSEKYFMSEKSLETILYYKKEKRILPGNAI